MTMSLLAVH